MEPLWADLRRRDPQGPCRGDATRPLERATRRDLAKINGERHFLWRAVGHGGEVPESYVTKTRDKKAALKFFAKTMLRHGRSEKPATDELRSYGAALKKLGAADKQETGRWLNTRAKSLHSPFRRRERALLRFRSTQTLRNSPPSTPRTQNTSIRTQPLQPGQLVNQPRPPSRREAGPRRGSRNPCAAETETNSHLSGSIPPRRTSC